MTLVAGCYERFLFGYAYNAAIETKAGSLQRSFTYPAHQGPVKCVAASGHLVASGGADDQIHLYDVQTGSDLGFLMSPGDGAVTAVKFYMPPSAATPTHLFTASADGGVSIWKAGGGWECLKTMTGHRKEVTGLTIHPTGRLALSLARDQTLRLWDLVKGRCPYDTKVPAGSELVEFATTGSTYGVCCGKQVMLHSVSDEGSLLASLEHQRKVMCLAYLSDDLLLTGCEDGSCWGWDTRSRQPAFSITSAHATRIRGLALLPSSASTSSDAAGSPDPGSSWVATGASDGVVRVWDLRLAGSRGNSQSKPLCEASTSARLTCLCSVAPVDVLEQQRLEAKAQTKAVRKQQQGQQGKTPAVAKRQAGPVHSGPADPGDKPRLKANATIVSASKKRAKPGVAGPQAANQPNAAAAKAAKTAADTGVIHDGVVDFGSDDTPRKKKRQKQKHKQAGKQQPARPLGKQAQAQAVSPAAPVGNAVRIKTKRRKPRPS